LLRPPPLAELLGRGPGEAAVDHTSPGLGGAADDEVFVVYRAQGEEEDLLGLVPVPQIGSRIVLTRVARAVGIERSEVPAVFRPGEVEAPVTGVDRGIAGHP